MQALLITAYKNTEQLIKLIESASKNFRVFLHIDKKSNIDIEEVRRRSPSTQVINEFHITWGGYNHLAAIIALIKMALQDEKITYIHVISGQDMLVRNYAEFDKAFSKTDRIYMDCRKIDEAGAHIQKRLKYVIPSANWDREKISVLLINKGTYLLQRLFHIERKKLGSFERIYKGLVWVSMPTTAAQYTVTYADKNPKFMDDLMHTTIPEEFFFQTILMNSAFRENIVCDSLRYMDWNRRNGSCPAVLDESDFNKIKERGKYFARKIDPGISGGLINMIEDSIK